MVATPKYTFPMDRAEKRRVLLDAVESIRDVLAAHADEAEEVRDLAPAAVEALIAWARHGPPAARVADLRTSDADAEGVHSGFELRPSA